MQLRFWSTWEFVTGDPVSIAEFKDLSFIHNEEWQQNNPQNILFLVKYECGEIKNNSMKFMWMLLMPLTFYQILRGLRTLQQMLFWFSGY